MAHRKLIYVEDVQGDVVLAPGRPPGIPATMGRLKDEQAHDPDRLYKAIDAEKWMGDEGQFLGWTDRVVELPVAAEKVVRDAWDKADAEATMNGALYVEASRLIAALVPEWNEPEKLSRAMKHWEAVEPVATNPMREARALWEDRIRDGEARLSRMTKAEVDAVDPLADDPFA
jgi:hypothetical protein|tara:strand:+ start:554 stop:1072 length:519 start_codon:yes stop_codon:yes gene_type:complete